MLNEIKSKCKLPKFILTGCENLAFQYLKITQRKRK